MRIQPVRFQSGKVSFHFPQFQVPTFQFNNWRQLTTIERWYKGNHNETFPCSILVNGKSRMPDWKFNCNNLVMVSKYLRGQGGNFEKSKVRKVILKIDFKTVSSKVNLRQAKTVGGAWGCSPLSFAQTNIPDVTPNFVYKSIRISGIFTLVFIKYRILNAN